ncbi:uncharacterized protein PS065_005871 [Dugong dugon]
MSPPVSPGSISSKDPTSHSALITGPVTPKEFPTPQKDFQTVPMSPVEAPVSPAQAGLPTKKDSTLLALSVPKDSSPQSASSSLEMSLSPEATLVKKSLVEPLPLVKPASAPLSPLSVLHSPASIIKTNPCASPDPASLLLKSSPTAPAVSTTAAPTGIPNKKDPATPAGVALITTKGTSTPTTTACPFLEGDVSLVPKSRLAKEGTSSLATLPLVPSASESCPVAPALTSSPQDVSAFPATLARASEIPKSVPFPPLPPAGTPPDAKEIDSISHTSALVPAASSPEGPPNEKDSGASITTSSEEILTYLIDSPSPLRTSVSPQTKRPPTKKGSATSPATLTLALSVSKNEPVIPGSPIGNLSSPVSPLEASLPSDASLSFQGPKGSPAKKHSIPPSPKRAPTSPPVILTSPKEDPAVPSPKDTHTSPAVTPSSAKGSPGTLSPKKSPTPSPVTPSPSKESPATLSPKGAPILPPMTPPSSKMAPAVPSSKGDSAPAPIMTPPKGALAASSTTGAPTPPPVTPPPSKGAPATLSPKDVPTPLPMIPHSKEAPTPSPVTPKGAPAVPSTKGAPIPSPVTAPSSKGAPAAPSTKGVLTSPPVTPPPSKGAPTPSPVTPPSSKGAPAAPSTKGLLTSPPVTPPPSKGASVLPPMMTPPRGAPAVPSTKKAPTPSPLTPPSSKGAPAAPSTKGVPTPSPVMTAPKGAPIPPPVTPPSSKGAPEIQSTKDVPTSPAVTPPKETPATPSPQSSPTPPASVTCPLEAIAPQASKGLPTNKGPTAPKEALVAPSPESASVITAPTQKDSQSPPCFSYEGQRFCSCPECPLGSSSSV